MERQDQEAVPLLLLVLIRQLTSCLRMSRSSQGTAVFSCVAHNPCISGLESFDGSLMHVRFYCYMLITFFILQICLA